MLLAVASVWLLQFFMHKNQAPQVGVQQVSAVGGGIKVPTVEQLHKPLSIDIGFSKEKNPKHEDLVRVSTDFVVATFTAFGGTLDSIEYKEHLGKNKKPLKTVYHQNGYNADQRYKQPFLLAFEKDSPYFYRIAEKKVVDDKEIIVFEAKHAGWLIRKIYQVHKEGYQIDFSVEFKPASGKPMPLQPRVFVAAPYVHEIADNTITSFVLNEKSQSIEKLDAATANGMAWYWGGPQTIIGGEDRYFVHALAKDHTKFVQRAYFNHVDPKSAVTILEGAQVKEASSWTMSFYMGPKLYDHLALVDEKLGDILSFGWLTFLCKIILKLLDYIYQLVGNYGLAIILVSIIIKVPFFPLMVFTRKKTVAYQKHQPYIQRIRQKFKNDQKMQQQELMRYHKDHNISPAAPMIGCFPLLVQIPLLFSLYRVLNSYLDLYHAPFFGWIIDLSAKDPYYMLPVLMGATTIAQQYFTPMPGGDGKQRVTMTFFAIIMTIVFANFPAGLVLYWLMNNLLTAAEGYVQQKFFK